MKFPKEPKKKKIRRHGKSILAARDGTCYLCRYLYDDHRKHAALHKHHIFGGPNRWKSEEDGLFVWLCVYHHETGEEAVHSNAYIMQMLHEIGQEAYERIHSRREFMERYGKNYRED